MSFTTGSLFHHESVKLAALYLEKRDWSLVREHVISTNLLQTRKLNSSKRICREIISRLKKLTAYELDILVRGNTHDQGHILWLALCRRYKFIGDFAIEVLRERYLTLKYYVKLEDFDCFFNQKSDWHSELNEIKPTTKQRIRQLLFKMAKEAGLVSPENRINPAILNPALINYIYGSSRQDLMFFPAADANILMMVKVAK